MLGPVRDYARGSSWWTDDVERHSVLVLFDEAFFFLAATSMANGEVEVTKLSTNKQHITLGGAAAPCDENIYTHNYHLF
jgi:hypothetical protein